MWCLYSESDSMFNKTSLVSLFEKGAGGGEVVMGAEDLKDYSL